MRSGNGKLIQYYNSSLSRMERFRECLGDCHRFNAGHVSAVTASATHVHTLTSHCTSTSSLSCHNCKVFFPQLPREEQAPGLSTKTRRRDRGGGGIPAPRFGESRAWNAGAGCHNLRHQMPPPVKLPSGFMNATNCFLHASPHADTLVLQLAQLD